MRGIVLFCGTKKSAFVFICLFLLYILSGCAGLTPSLIDDIVPKVSKGYVEFYSGDGWLHTPGYRISEGNQTWGYSRPFSPVRFARIPGNYTFKVEHGDAVLRIPVIVQAGMVTPIKLQQVINRTEYGYPTTKYHFTIFATVEPYRVFSDITH